MNFTTDEISLWMFGTIGLIIVSGTIIKIVNKFLDYKIEKQRLNGHRTNHPIHMPQVPPIPLVPKQTISDKLKEFQDIDAYLITKLETIYASFIYKKLLYTLKMYTSLAEATKKELRKEFIEYVDFNTTQAEKDIFKSRYTFQQFKFICINFFNIKTTKLELFVIQKVEIPETEFKDYKLIESLFNDLTSKEMNDILASLNDDTNNTNHNTTGGN